MGAQVFISYRRTQLEQVRPLAEVLRATGLEVFFDLDAIDPLADFPERIRDGLARSHAALIFWSKDYADSDICLQELRLAWQHARRHSSDLARRVWILNPEADARHIEAGELGSSNYLVPPAPDTAAAWAGALRARAAELVPEGPLADEHGALPAIWVYGAPARSPRFTGRGRELWQIHRLLHPARVGGALKGVAVRTHGLGGIGKTELAAAYVHDFAAAYPGGVFWLNLATYVAPQPGLETAESAWLDALARTLAGHPWLSGEPPALRLTDSEGKPLPAARVRARVAELLGERASLWVLDNVPTLRPDDLRARILDAWAAPGPHGRTLITTRDRREAAGYGEIPLDVLGEDDALRLLARFRRPANAAEADAARKLAAEVGRHTLALALLGHRAQQATLGYREVLAHLHAKGRLERIERIAERLRPTLGESARGILATFAGSLEPLSEPARRLLGLAAVCVPNTPIPPALLADAYARLEGVPEDETDRADQVDDGLRELVEESLLTRRDGDEGFLDIHPLLAEAALALLDLTADAVAPVLMAALLERLAEAGDIRRHGELAADIPHARHLALAGDNENAVRLALQVGEFELARGDYQAAQEVENHARTRAEKALGGEHALTLTAMNNLAETLRARGDFADARHLNEQVLAVRRRALGEEHPSTLVSMNNLAATLANLGHAAGARDWHERALAVYRRVLGEEHPATLRSMNNLAATLADLGDVAGARDWLERALAVYRRVLGEEHPDTLVSMNNLAETLRALGDAAGARDWFERALAARRRVLGEEHPDTSLSAWNLFATLLDLGEKEAAQRIVENHLAGLPDRDPAALGAQERAIREGLMAWLDAQAAPPPVAEAPEAPASPETPAPEGRPRGWLGRFKGWWGGQR
jgi:tetratricopeptide (TPR) repeat protein